MRALVTGATGFIGNHLVLALRQRGWDVVCMLRRVVTASDAGIRCVYGDLTRPESLDLGEVERGSVDVLLHFAARMPANEIPREQYMTENAEATERLLKTAARLDIKSVVYASSLPVIGVPQRLPITEDHPTNPRHPYHLSKLHGEMACETARQTGRRITSLRITSPYGPGMVPKGVLARFVSQALHSEDIQWLGDGSRAQNFVHVCDVVRAAQLAAVTDHPGIYNIGGPETTNMRELAQIVARLTPGTRSKLSAAAVADPEQGRRWEVDNSRALKGLGYRPQVSLEQGLAEYIRNARGETEPSRWWRS
jgi:nucleoside-diphosphate-sugar epimerase